MSQRALSLVLSFSLVWGSAAPALAAVARESAHPEVVPVLPVLPPSAALVAPRLDAAANAAAAVETSAAQPTGQIQLQAMPGEAALTAAPQGEAAGALASEGFDTAVLRRDESMEVGALAGVAAPSPLAAAQGPSQSRSVKVLPAGAERRTSFAPLASAALFGAFALAFAAAAWLVPGLSAREAIDPNSLGPTLVGAAFWTAAGAALTAAAFGVADVSMFAYAMIRGKGATEEELARFVRAEAVAGRLHPSIVPLIRAYEPIPGHRWRDMTYGAAHGGFIYVRPELARVPWIFRLVLLHEHRHVERLKARGPPPSTFWGRMGSYVASEASAYWGEVSKIATGATTSAVEVRVPKLERALRQTQLSLRLDRPYDVLVINASRPDIKDAAMYKRLSGGTARVEELETDSPHRSLEGRGLRYRAVVIDRPGTLLPSTGTEERRKLDQTLRQLESLHVLASRGVRLQDSGFPEASSDFLRYADLAEKIQRLGGVGTKASAAAEEEVRALWREVASDRLKGLPARTLIENLYGSLQGKGLSFLTFRPEDPGVATWERLLRYWEAADGGQFRATRIDLEDGGHVLAMRKLDNRIPLWLSPERDGTITESVPNAAFSPEAQEKARQALIKAGFGDQLAKFDELHVQIEHVLGADVGRQQIAVTVPRNKEKALKGWSVSKGLHHVQPGMAGIMPEMMDSPALMHAPAAWNLGFKGSEDIMVIDTGGDRTHEDLAGLESLDLTHEGHEDWNGHGTLVVAILRAVSGVFPGLAPAARVIIAKVFGRDTPGAADGPIMGAGTAGLLRGVVFINASLGTRGHSGSNLSTFFSGLTEKKNAKGEYLLFIGSAGNSGPADMTLSSPGNAKRGLTVAAANKSPDDGRPEIAFYSSVGPDYDPNYAVQRLFLKPDVTCIGGDVVTDPGDPNVYKRGVFAAKSKDMAPAPSDLPDRKHTAMSGTSMAAPMCTGAAADILSALRRTGALKAVPPDQQPWLIKSIMMATATDMQVPAWFQGAGLVDLKAAMDLVMDASGAIRGRVAAVPGLSWTAGAPTPGAFAWVERYKQLVELEDEIYRATDLSRDAARERLGQGLADDAETPPELRNQIGNEAAQEALKSFAAERDKALPAVRNALTDESWLVRRQAAMTLLNLRSPDAALDLAQAALHDPDARVRQMAFMALAETQGRSTDILLQKATRDARWDVALYAAYALARRGDLSALSRMTAGLSSEEKNERFTATWLLGQLGKRATPAVAEALAAKVAQAEGSAVGANGGASSGKPGVITKVLNWLLSTGVQPESADAPPAPGQGGERGNIRHLAAAALANLAKNAPDTLSSKVVGDLLVTAGLDNLALTRTIEKVFPIATTDKAFVERLRQEPLRTLIVDFIVKNKAAATKPGALGELVQRLAKLLDVALDEPTPQPDPVGRGVAGVDPLLGPLDILVEPHGPSRPTAYWDESKGGDAAAVFAAAGFDPRAMERLEATPRAVLPISGALWISVPEHKLYAFAVEMERLGVGVRLPSPRYTAARRAPDLIVEPGEPNVVRVRAAEGSSEAKIVAAVEAAAAEGLAKNEPVVISVDAVASSSLDHNGSMLSVLLSRLILAGVGAVAPAGNEGPREGTLSAPLDTLAPVVAAAARATGLQSYSGRGRSGQAPIAWAEVVDEMGALGGAQGTGEAAERSAVKTAALGRVVQKAFKDAGRPLPQGWFLLVRAAVERTLAPVRVHGPHAVGGGLFADAAPAKTLLERRLKDLDGAARDAEALMVAARKRMPDLVSNGNPVGPVAKAAAAVLQQLSSGPMVDSAARWIEIKAEDFVSYAAPDKPKAPNAWWSDPKASHTAAVISIGAHVSFTVVDLATIVLLLFPFALFSFHYTF